jgi:hypothetical protein
VAYVGGVVGVEALKGWGSGGGGGGFNVFS